MRVNYNGVGPDYCDEACVVAGMWTSESNVADMYVESSNGELNFPANLG